MDEQEINDRIHEIETITLSGNRIYAIALKPCVGYPNKDIEELNIHNSEGTIYHKYNRIIHNGIGYDLYVIREPYGYSWILCLLFINRNIADENLMWHEAKYFDVPRFVENIWAKAEIELSKYTKVHMLRINVKLMEGILYQDAIYSFMMSDVSICKQSIFLDRIDCTEDCYLVAYCQLTDKNKTFEKIKSMTVLNS